MYLSLFIVFYKFECGKDVRTLFADGNSVLEMGSGLAVFGTAGPTVLLREFDILGTHADHGLDGYDHSLFEKGTSSRYTKIGHIGAFVHLEADSMAAELTDYGVAVLLAMHLNCMTDIPDTVTFFTLVKSYIESLFGCLKKTLHLGGNFATGERVGRVGTHAIELDHKVQRDIVALLDKHIVAGDAMNDDIVYRDAKRSGEALVAFAERDTTVVADKLLSYFVQESSGYTGTYMTAHLSERSPKEVGSVTD
jgi:hypothetical protein